MMVLPGRRPRSLRAGPTAFRRLLEGAAWEAKTFVRDAQRVQDAGQWVRRGFPENLALDISEQGDWNGAWRLLRNNGFEEELSYIIMVRDNEMEEKI